jgi:maltooligosyltrehalose trehalohydrolase
VEDVATTLRQGWTFEHGGIELPPRAFVHCIQNHDQVGNRAMGDRLNHDVPLPVYRALSALLLLSPYTPLLWMGQEWAASSPFQYFTDHPEELGRLVTEGRRKEFRQFSAFRDASARARIPDPQAEETFGRSKLEWDEAARMPHQGVLTLYRELLRLRREEPALRARGREAMTVATIGDRALVMRRSASGGPDLLVLVNLGDALAVAMSGSLVLDTEDPRFGGEAAAIREEDRVRFRRPGAVVLRG